MASPFPHRPVSPDGAPFGEPEAFRAVGSEPIWFLRPEEGSSPIPVTIRQGSRRRARLCIRVRPEGAVELLLPTWAGPEDIRAALLKRAGWIARHVAAARARPSVPAPCHAPGERHPYLGRMFTLDILAGPAAPPGKPRGRKGRQTVRLEAGRLVVRLPAPTPEKVEAALAAWYAGEAARVFARRLEAIRPLVPWLTRTPPLRLRAMRGRWGSCSARGTLTLNTHLIKAPRRCIDYVLFHEAAHLREMNHSPRFYALLSRIMPDWKNVRRELEDFAPLILPRRAPRDLSPERQAPGSPRDARAEDPAGHDDARPLRAFPAP